MEDLKERARELGERVKGVEAMIVERSMVAEEVSKVVEKMRSIVEEGRAVAVRQGGAVGEWEGRHNGVERKIKALTAEVRAAERIADALAREKDTLAATLSEARHSAERGELVALPGQPEHYSGGRRASLGQPSTSSPTIGKGRSGRRASDVIRQSADASKQRRASLSDSLERLSGSGRALSLSHDAPSGCLQP